MGQILKAVEHEGKMLVTVGAFRGSLRTRLIDCTHEEYNEWRTSGKFIQDAMPNTNPEDREFLISGTTPEEWEEIFGGLDE